MVTFLCAYLAKAADRYSIRKMDSMTPQEYVAYRHRLVGHSYLSAFVVVLILGVLYLGAIELVALAVRSLKTRNPAA